MTTHASSPSTPAVETVDRVVVRFAGDSGDGMQVTGQQFTNTSAFAGNDISTYPDFPAEIRAPAGSLPGVSGFQINFASHDIHTPGDNPDVLVAMNPAALKVNLKDLPLNGLLIVNEDNFGEKNLKLAGYDTNPLEDSSLDGYRTVPVPLTTLTRKALVEVDLPRKQVDRCKNFFALGIMYYLYNRPTGPTEAWLNRYFAKRPDVAEANVTALKAGIAYCEASRLFHTTYRVEKADFSAGRYRNINGNTAMSIGLIAAARQAKTEMLLASYPITPASDILHALSKHKRFGVMTFQAEDEISAVCAAIGAAFAGKIAVTTTSGPGMALKGEAIGLAVAVELPLVIINVQRGGPSTGLPTKTEQADLFQALWGRNSEAPLPIIASSTPGDCFWTAIEAVRLALKYMTPVILLSDGYVANGAEPWPIPSVDDLPDIPVEKWTTPEDFQPYRRNEQTLARPWAVPGTPGLEHRIGGLEKENVTGHVSYDSTNHETMVHLREQRIRAIENDIPEAEVDGAQEGDLLIVAWGSTLGTIRSAMRQIRDEGLDVGHVHLRHLNPLPRNLGDILKRYRHVLVPELNLGQLTTVLRARYLVDAQVLSKMQGRPFRASEIVDAVRQRVKE
ncbi:2-oxoacid:acceptor oxidoreductase subunit alpha [bacterium]|nr:2-oxoacid:acceptor oxidoreductase subunit alpha [bacterium]